MNSPRLLTLLLTLAMAGISLYGCKEDIGGTTEVGPPWVTFTTSNSPLPDNVINKVYADRELRIWFATPMGAANYKDKSWGVIKDSLRYYTYDNGGNQYSNYNVTSIAQGKDRSVWFGLKGGGIARFNQYSQIGKIWTRYRSPLLMSDYVGSVAADVSDATLNGEMWIISGGGVSRLIQNSTNGGQWIDYQEPSFPTIAIASPFDYSIWIGSVSDGLEVVSYSPGFSKGPIPLPAGYVGQITDIAFDAAGNVWISKDIGVSVLNMKSGLWTHYSSASTNGQLPHSEIHAVTTDLGSNRWFGTDSGLVHLADTTWSRFTMANSPLPNDTVTSITYDMRGNLWIGTRQGVAAYRPEGTRF